MAHVSSPSDRPADSLPDPLAQRYGVPSPGRRTALLVVVGALVVALLGWLVWAMAFHADPAVSSEEIGHKVVDDHTATIRVRVTYGDDPVEATCKARAISHDKTIVGEASFAPTLEDGVIEEITLRTDRRATTVEWIGCNTSGQPRYR